MYTEEELDIRRNLNTFRYRFGKEALLEEYDSQILQLKNPSLSAYFALLGGEYAEEHADIVLESGNMQAITELSYHFPKHLAYLLNSHDVHYNLEIMKGLFITGIYQYDKEGHPNSEVGKISKQLFQHAESISKSDNIDDLITYLKWYAENIQLVKDYHVGSGWSTFGWTERVGLVLLKESNQTLKDIVQKIAHATDAEKIYEAYSLFITIKKATLNRDDIDLMPLHEGLARTKNPKYNYDIVKDYYLSDELITMHENAVIESKNPEYNYLFALKGKPLKEKHATVIKESQDPKYNYMYAANVRGANVLEHLEVVIQSKNAEYCYLFALKLKDNKQLQKEEIKRLAKAIIDSKSPQYNYLFMKDISNVYERKHLKVIADSKDAKYNYLCCLLESEKDQHNRLAVLASEDVEYNYKMALKFPNDPLFDEYLQVVLASDNEEYKAKVSELKPLMIKNINQKIKRLQLSQN